MKNLSWLLVAVATGTACSGRSHSLGGENLEEGGAGGRSTGGNENAGGDDGYGGEGSGGNEGSGGRANTGGNDWGPGAGGSDPWGDGGGPGSGGYVNAGGDWGAGGCMSAAGASGYGGSSSTGGRYSGPPTCPVDPMGFATVAMSELCGLYRCPAEPAELLGGLVCDQVTTSREGFTRTVGCGLETIELNGYGRRSAYAASFDATTGAFVGLKLQEMSPFGTCNAFGYIAGSVRGACADEVVHACRSVAPGGAAAPAYAGCRAPTEAGCAQCCVSNPPYCNVWSAQQGSTSYDVSGGHEGACTCGCQPCAECTIEDERQLRIAMERPECNCDEVPAGEPCASYCGFTESLKAKCPGLVP